MKHEDTVWAISEAHRIDLCKILGTAATASLGPLMKQITDAIQAERDRAAVLVEALEYYVKMGDSEKGRACLECTFDPTMKTAPFGTTAKEALATYKEGEQDDK